MQSITNIASYQKLILRLLFFVALAFYASVMNAQQITGVWKGKIDKKKVELKIIQNGDSLTGTSYYYESPTNYRRYSIRGYFDQQTNSAVWWDDQLLEEKTGNNLFGGPGKMALLARADFNCPGGGEMFLEGHAARKNEPLDTRGPVDLEKVSLPGFPDEWDYVIENYTIGGNDPYIIDSIGMIASSGRPVFDSPVSTGNPVADPRPVTRDETPVGKKETVFIPSIPETGKAVPQKPLSIVEKFVTRKKVFTTEIPVTTDSVELRFYDNAEIDGDSISLFLNDRLIFEHIRLTGNAYTIRIAATDLQESNELIMVAENLGSIPPNTSYMVAIVGEKRYEANLASTENSSAMIRLVRSKRD